MNDAAWGAVASAITAVGLLVIYLASRRHDEEIDDANSLSAAISAIGDAAVGVVTSASSMSTFVTSMIAPLKAEIDEMRCKEAACVERIDHLETQVAGIVGYVGDLRGQVRDLGGVPHPPPELDGFTFD